MQKSILITGCSTGIGYEAAKTLKERGYRVFASARKQADVERLQQEGFEAILLDVTSDDSIKHAIEFVLKKTGGTLDVLINNAGMMIAGAIEDLPREHHRKQFETNTFGAMELVRQVLPVMRQQGHGRIIQISSVLGLLTMQYYGAYNASKFALEAYSHTLRQELHGTDIFVSSINPGPIKTALRENAKTNYESAVKHTQSGHHQDAYSKLEQTYFKDTKKADFLTLEPKAVVAKIVRAIESRKPKVHYIIGWAPKMIVFLSKILPYSWVDWILRKA